MLWFIAVYLVVACAGGTSMIYQLSDDSTSTNLFTRVWQGPPMKDLYPIIISQPAGPLTVLADAPVGHGSPSVWQMSSLGTSDFVPRFVSHAFLDGNAIVRCSFWFSV